MYLIFNWPFPTSTSSIQESMKFLCIRIRQYMFMINFDIHRHWRRRFVREIIYSLQWSPFYLLIFTRFGGLKRIFICLQNITSKRKSVDIVLEPSVYAQCLISTRIILSTSWPLNPASNLWRANKYMVFFLRTKGYWIACKPSTTQWLYNSKHMREHNNLSWKIGGEPNAWLSITAAEYNSDRYLFFSNRALF